MHPVKYFWGIRALLYRVVLGKIGKMCYIGKPCFIEGSKHIFIGSRVRIFPGLRMQTTRTGEIHIGDNTAIEQNVHITSSGGDLKIGKNVTILADVFVTNMDHNYYDITKSILEQGVVEKETSIGDGCFIGFGAAIQAGTKLGKHCVVGAGSVVRGVFPDYSVIVGVPGHIIKKYDPTEKRWKRIKNTGDNNEINGY